MAPTGPITTRAPWGNGPSFGISWEAITQYDQFIHEAADPLGWPIERVRAHIVIESQGVATAVQQNNVNGWSYGLMQVVPYGVTWEGWHALVEQKAGLPAGAPRQQVTQALFDPRINILVGLGVLESFFQTFGSLDAASSGFFTGTPNWFGEDDVNRVTGEKYKAALNGLIAEQGVAVAAGAPANITPEVTAMTANDIISRIVSGAFFTADFGFGQPNFDQFGNPQHFYQYGVGHGTDADHKHTGIDISVPLGTTIRTPLAGVVRCVGGDGQGDWGQGCGAFGDTITGGVGNVTVMTDIGLKLTFGHVNQPLVALNERVEAWQPVATSGGMLGPHLHLDVVQNRPDLVSGGSPGGYWLVDPIPALQAVLNGQIDAGNMPAPIEFPQRLPVPQPGDWDVSISVKAVHDGVPVLQFADLNAPRVAASLAANDTFEAVMLVLGSDMNWYWVSRQGGRVPVAGTASLGGPAVIAA